MKQFNHILMGSILLVVTSPVWAAGSITISAPANDSVLQSATGNKLEFTVQLSPNGHHVHVYVDDQDPIVIRDVSHCPCNVALPKLASGKHHIVIKEATSGHAPTGVQSAVAVTVK